MIISSRGKRIGGKSLVMLVDKYGRPLTHMRISVTLRCNHSCIFCHMEGIPISQSSLNELSPKEYGLIVKAASDLGIRYYKLTGGEPLIRNDIIDIVKVMRPYASSISLTTNGSLLSKYAEELKEASIDYINVSLHSLRPEVFKFITKGDLNLVLKGIKDALNVGIKLKLDFLVLKFNENEFEDIINYASKYGLDINIIELIPLGITINEWRDMHVGLNSIERYLERIAVKKYIKEFQNRPTYVLPTGIKVTIVKGYANPDLCMRCTRIRLTPDGKLKLCIYRNDLYIDLKPALRMGDIGKIKELIIKANKLREPFFKRVSKREGDNG